MLAMRRGSRRYLARASRETGCGNQSGARMGSAPDMDRSGGALFSDRIAYCADSTMRDRARAVGLVSDADAVSDLQQSDPSASGADLLWTVSLAAIIRGQSGRVLGRAAEIPDQRDRSAGHRRAVVLASGSKIPELEGKFLRPKRKLAVSARSDVRRTGQLRRTEVPPP